MPRVFIAIPVAEPVRKALAGLPRDDGRSWRWVKEDLFHVTLKFLGEIPEADVAAVADGVAEAVTGTALEAVAGAAREAGTGIMVEAVTGTGTDAVTGTGADAVADTGADAVADTGADAVTRTTTGGSITLIARGIGAFPDSRRARVLWAGLGGQVDALGRVQRAIEEQLAQNGHPRGRRPFRPHITLARARGAGGPIPASLRKYETGKFGRWECDVVQVIESRLESIGPRYIVRHEIPLAGGGVLRGGASGRQDGGKTPAGAPG